MCYSGNRHNLTLISSELNVLLHVTFAPLALLVPSAGAAHVFALRRIVIRARPQLLAVGLVVVLRKVQR